MAHFAKLDENNIVTQVIVVHNNELIDDLGNESELKGIEFCQNIFGGRWIQTSYNNKIRKNFASVGYRYDESLDAFIPPKPYNSWILNQSTCIWECPIEHPNDDKFYEWDEATISWIVHGDYEVI